MGKIATKGWINVNKNSGTFPMFDAEQCPTRSEITSKVNFSVSGSYSSNQLVQEMDISYTKPPDPILETLKIVGLPFSGYYVSRTSQVSTGTMLLSPITLKEGDSLSAGFPFVFNVNLYVKNVNTNGQQIISASQNKAGNTVNLSI